MIKCMFFKYKSQITTEALKSVHCTVYQYVIEIAGRVFQKV